MKLCILLGGPSAERDVSIASGYGMAQALERRGHDVMLLDPATGRNMRIAEFQADPPKVEPPSVKELGLYSQDDVIMRSLTSNAVRESDLVVFGLHGVPGEDGVMQAVLDLEGKRYTGSSARTTALCIDKQFTKSVLKDGGIPVPRGLVLTASQHPPERHAAWQFARSEYGLPLVIKPNDTGSTVGLTILKEESEDGFNAGVNLALDYSTKVLVEEFVEGRELTVGILGREALPIIEITTAGGFYDYHHKYTPGMSFHECPAKLPTELASAIQADALRAFEVTGCSGYARVDFRLRPDGSYACLEINTLPGMTSTSLMPDAAKAAGISFDELCERIVQAAISYTEG